MNEQTELRFDFGYDALNCQTTSKDLYNILIASQYDAADRRVRVEDSLGGLTTSTYNAAGQLLDRTLVQTLSSGDTVRLNVEQTYDKAGQLSRVYYRDAAGTTVVEKAYGYDAVGRVNAVWHNLRGNPGWYVTETTYDRAGRVTRERDMFNQTSSTTTNVYTGEEKASSDRYNDNGLLLVSPSMQLWFDYDREGNIITTSGNTFGGGKWTYQYDAAGRLVFGRNHTLVSSEYQSSYGYDALGQRFLQLSKRQHGYVSLTRTTVEATFFVHDQGQVWADLDENKNLRTRYLLGDGPNGRYAKIGSDGRVDWYVRDRNGQLRQTVNEQGKLSNFYYADRRAFDDELADRWRMGGDQQTDKFIGLTYSSAGRYDDPRSGQSLNADPRVLRTGQTRLGLNTGWSPVSTSSSLGSTEDLTTGNLSGYYAMLYNLASPVISVYNTVGYGVTSALWGHQAATEWSLSGVGGAATVWSDTRRSVDHVRQGFVDGLSFGLTSWLRWQSGYNTVDESTSEYRGGQLAGAIAGMVISSALSGGSAAALFGARISGAIRAAQAAGQATGLSRAFAVAQTVGGLASAQMAAEQGDAVSAIGGLAGAAGSVFGVGGKVARCSTPAMPRR